MIALICLALAIVAYVISQLQIHGQLGWSKADDGFWGTHSWVRKYKAENQPKFLFSTTLLVSLTDGYHQMQFWMFNFLALSLTFAQGWNWYLFGGLMIGIRLVHWGARKLFGK